MSQLCKVVFLGVNPPQNSGTTEPFKNCASGKLLQKWIDYLGLDPSDYILMNLTDKPTPNNRPLNRDELFEASARLMLKLPQLNLPIVVALGKQPMEVVRSLFLEYGWVAEDLLSGAVGLPHPSPRNRELNQYKDKMPIDKLEKVKTVITECWIEQI